MQQIKGKKYLTDDTKTILEQLESTKRNVLKSPEQLEVQTGASQLKDKHTTQEYESNVGQAQKAEGKGEA